MNQGGDAAFFKIVRGHFEADLAVGKEIVELIFEFFIGVGDDEFAVGQRDVKRERAEAFEDGSRGDDGFGRHDFIFFELSRYLGNEQVRRAEKSRRGAK